MQQLIKETFEALGCFDFNAPNRLLGRFPKVKFFIHLFIEFYPFIFTNEKYSQTL
jgi:hypothetical protein